MNGMDVVRSPVDQHSAHTDESIRPIPGEKRRSELLANVQLLRAAAALLVILDHMHGELGKSDPGARSIVDSFRYFGQSGVDLFFVISGFIIVATNWNQFGVTGSSLKFLLRRVARIFPPYWLVLLPIIAVYFMSARSLMHTHAGRADVLSSIFLLPSTKPHLLDTSWTLTYELFFYCMFGFILVSQRRHLLPCLAAWAIGTLSATLVFQGSPNAYLSFLSLPLPLEFIAGALVGYAYKTNRMPGYLFVGIIGLIAFGSLWIVALRTDILSDPTNLRILQYGVPATLLLYGAVGIESYRACRSPRRIVFFGDASYSLYLWHSPIIIVLGFLAARLKIHGELTDTIWQFLTLAIVMSVSVGAYRYVEKPLTLRLNNLIRDAFSGPHRDENLDSNASTSRQAGFAVQEN